MNITRWTALILAALQPAALLASSDTDQKIERTARDSYTYRTVLGGRVEAHAVDGVVTLTGTVDDSGQRDLAAQTAADLPGVERVVNHVSVAPGAKEHSDSWIAVEIRASLLMHSGVSAASTHVEVNDGVVTLTGGAESAGQKDLTEYYARQVDGVRDVRNEMAVGGPTARQAMTEAMDDGSITAELKIELASHRATSALYTRVETTQGVVMIRGEARSPAEKAFVTRLAEGIRGVRSVDNRMVVIE
jgi:osmotically-inducible protein OsmY